MVGWHHQLNGHAFEQTLGDNGGQRSLACCSPWGGKESDTTEHTNIETVEQIYSSRSDLLGEPLDSPEMNDLLGRAIL